MLFRTLARLYNTLKYATHSPMPEGSHHMKEFAKERWLMSVTLSLFAVRLLLQLLQH